MDTDKTSVRENSRTLLHICGGPSRFVIEPSSTTVWNTPPSLRGDCDTCVHLRLEPVDITYTPSHCARESNSTENVSGERHSLGDCTSLIRASVVPPHYWRCSNEFFGICDHSPPSVWPSGLTQQRYTLVENTLAGPLSRDKQKQRETVCDLLM